MVAELQRSTRKQNKKVNDTVFFFLFYMKLSIAVLSLESTIGDSMAFSNVVTKQDTL